jgi:hypothetical protein
MKLKQTKEIGIISAKKTNLFQTVFKEFSENASTSVIIPNACPVNESYFLNGFTKEIFKNFPIVKANYEISKNKPGTVSFIDAVVNNKTKTKIIVANMYCQTKINKERSINYGLLAYCMYDLKRHNIMYKKNNPDLNIEIHSPKIGSGITGANWMFVADLMLDIWEGQKLYVYAK